MKTAIPVMGVVPPWNSGWTFKSSVNAKNVAIRLVSIKWIAHGQSHAPAGANKKSDADFRNFCILYIGAFEKFSLGQGEKRGWGVVCRISTLHPLGHKFAPLCNYHVVKTSNRK